MDEQQARVERRRKYKRNYDRERNAANPEANRARVRKWREENPEKRREQARRDARRARAKDPERLLEQHRKWRERNPGAERKSKRAWAEKNQERRRGYEAKRRALKHGAIAENVDPGEVFKRDGWCCQICGAKTEGEWPEPLSPSLDHIVPLAQGGAHSYENVQLTHFICNMRKGASLAA